MRGTVHVIAMCILYCILHIRMRLRYLAVPIGLGYVGVVRFVAEVAWSGLALRTWRCVHRVECLVFDCVASKAESEILVKIQLKSAVIV